ncbi:7-dehydrocholesterol reductase [Candidatus Protochlamydia naegleriophila]|uniref:7-dehydrocholesterol reductase n=1 Tax=Candidatus Protochlamydia naegleriophila TaxID=389348 RepID=A0A0U5EQ78_9BACT|nr:7-dehydrocholesterol reductase [Candidatus Protochlamydia naegleriophila]CUI16288.1 7-dehydrocholesterol reductase [Candidatus Protochlamydia naegleriophila]
MVFLEQKSNFRHTFGPLLLLLLCPPTVFAFWYTNVYLNGSLLKFGELLWQQGLLQTLEEIWFPYFFGTTTAWTILAIFAVFELVLMRALPGKTYEGPTTPAGHVPLYKANGVPAYLVTLVTFYLASFHFQLFSPTIIYDHFAGLLGALNIFSLWFCLFLLLKGHFAPSSRDVGGSGNVIFDYYWGMELYPRLWGWDIKQFTNCRFGMMGWPLILLSFAAKQQQLYDLSDSMIVAVALQLIYITKFFIWEPGYLRSLDIMHDRAGYYICWGCLVWVPGIYTSPTLYLVNHPNHLGYPFATLLFVLGTAGIMINYLADRQRQQVRAKQGSCLVWGKPPALTIAHYMTETGESKHNLLLSSGWWGLSRHFHYLPELLAAFCWSAPALFEHFLPYFYFTFLTILLIDRAFRDDRRCLHKYGEDWQLYCQKVPYKIIPYVI